MNSCAEIKTIEQFELFLCKLQDDGYNLNSFPFMDENSSFYRA